MAMRNHFNKQVHTQRPLPGSYAVHALVPSVRLTRTDGWLYAHTPPCTVGQIYREWCTSLRVVYTQFGAKLSQPLRMETFAAASKTLRALITELEAAVEGG